MMYLVSLVFLCHCTASVASVGRRVVIAGTDCVAHSVAKTLHFANIPK